MLHALHKDQTTPRTRPRRLAASTPSPFPKGKRYFLRSDSKRCTITEQNARILPRRYRTIDSRMHRRAARVLSRAPRARVKLRAYGRERCSGLTAAAYVVRAALSRLRERAARRRHERERKRERERERERERTGACTDRRNPKTNGSG